MALVSRNRTCIRPSPAEPGSGRGFLLLVMLCFATGAPLSAQHQPSISPGTRLLVVLERQPLQEEGWADAQTLRGTLISPLTDSLTLQIHPGASPIRVAASSLARVYVSRGIPSRTESALRHGAWGALLGATEVSLLESIAKDPLFSSPSRAMIAGAAVGAAGGALWGALRPQERWKRLRMSRGGVD